MWHTLLLESQSLFFLCLFLVYLSLKRFRHLLHLSYHESRPSLFCSFLLIFWNYWIDLHADVIVWFCATPLAWFFLMAWYWFSLPKKRKKKKKKKKKIMHLLKSIDKNRLKRDSDDTWWFLLLHNTNKKRKRPEMKKKEETTTTTTIRNKMCKSIM